MAFGMHECIPEMTSRIVIIEDNPADAKVLQLAIHQSDPNIEITVLSDGKAALDFFTTEEPGSFDIVILDLNLPIVSGFEILEHVKCDPALKAIPVLVLSGSSYQQDIERSLQLGANSYLCKPAGIEEVFEMGAEIVRYWFVVSHLRARHAATVC